MHPSSGGEKVPRSGKSTSFRLLSGAVPSRFKLIISFLENEDNARVMEGRRPLLNSIESGEIEI